MGESTNAKELFCEAIQLTPDERMAFLERACGSDVQRRERVEQLLRAYEQAPEFLTEPTYFETTPATPAATTSESVGSTIGPYKLLEQIGEGGFGTVYMAEQDRPVRRCVALKILKAGMDTRQVVARFEVERQALAMMDHPNIARVLDGGATQEGRPYFVMELVRGMPITGFCDQNRLTATQRLTLFADVCHAVQHAHQKGIIHRDLKPNNVLVWRHDAKPVVKIIDFGIAKATGPKLTDKTLFTELRQMVGTPAYMSPEQAGLSDLDIDTRSDIYSLGVLLYELLTGTTPFDVERLRRADFDELRRIIREEEPPKPSTRVGSLESFGTKVGEHRKTSEAAAWTPAGSPKASSPQSISWDIAAARHTDPRSLPRLLRGDLDWIVMKCLEKDRQRRYETANGLAMDVQRHLAAEPVIAAPPSWRYRARKLIHRHRGAVLTALIVSATTLAGMIGTLWQAARAMEQRSLALAAQDRALKVKSLLERMLTASNAMYNALRGGPARASLKPDVKLIDILDEITPTLEGEFKAEPEVEADVRYALGKSFFGLSRFAESRTQLERALELYRDLLNRDDPRALDCLNILGFSYWWSSAPEQAEQAFREAVAGFERTAPQAPEAIDAKSGLALFLYNYEGDPDEAVRLAREVLALRRQIAPEESRDVFMAKTTLAHVLQQSDSLEEADLLATEALEQCIRNPLSRSTADEWFCRIQAFDCAMRFERIDEAEEQGRNLVRIADQVAGPVSFMATLARRRLGGSLQAQGRWAEAEELFRQSLAAQRMVFDAGNGDTMDTANALARVLFEQWQLEPERTALRDEAQSLAEEVAAAWVDTPRHILGTPDGELLVEILEARHAAEPQSGFDKMAAQWRARIAPRQDSTQLGTPSLEPSERAPPRSSP